MLNPNTNFNGTNVISIYKSQINLPTFISNCDKTGWEDFVLRSINIYHNKLKLLKS